ncbi:MAG: cupin domain-containing protein [Saprospiraceae bacterium]|nr:cupin domain-containing protein [Saprospiraceae bacterium]
MLIKSLSQIESFIAGDKTIIREWLHPKNDSVEIAYSVAFAEVEPGNASLPHTLNNSSELYIILEGEGLMHIDQETQIVRNGDLIFIPAGAEQFIENTSEHNLRFICIVSPPWRSDDEVVF